MAANAEINPITLKKIDRVIRRVRIVTTGTLVLFNRAVLNKTAHLAANVLMAANAHSALHIGQLKFKL